MIMNDYVYYWKESVSRHVKWLNGVAIINKIIAQPAFWRVQLFAKGNLRRLIAQEQTVERVYQMNLAYQRKRNYLFIVSLT